MDLICLILWIIDLAKPSIVLSIAILIVSVLYLMLLVYNKKLRADVTFFVVITGIVVALIKICTL